MDIDIQNHRSPQSTSSEFLMPDVPCSSIQFNNIDNRKQPQGAKRPNEQEELIVEESHDDYESFSDTSTKSAKSKKQKSERLTAAQRNNLADANNKKLILQLGQANEKISDLVKRVSELENKLLLLLEKSDSSPPQHMLNLNQTSIDFWSKLPKQTTHEITQAVRQETFLLDKKEKNVIVFGLPGSNSDNENSKLADERRSIDEILTAINVKNEIGEYKYRRLKNKNQQSNVTGPVIIELESIAKKFKLLKASKNLDRNGPFKNIYINPDRTSAELEVEKKLRLERNQKNSELEHTGSNGMKFGKFTFTDGGQAENFYWGIRNAKLQRIKIRQVELDY